jgi:hypothetical protein
MARRWESKGRGREGGEDGGDAWRTAVLASFVRGAEKGWVAGRGEKKMVGPTVWRGK